MLKSVMHSPNMSPQIDGVDFEAQRLPELDTDIHRGVQGSEKHSKVMLLTVKL